MPTPTTVQARFQVRADTAANWTTANPTLLLNEIGIETDTKKLKMGDGTTAWASLAYFPSIVSGGTVLGNLEIGTTGTLTFEGSTADGFETTLGVIDPTADRTINLPNESGTVYLNNSSSNFITTGSVTAASLIPSGSTVPTNGVYLPAANTVGIATNTTSRLTINASGTVAIPGNLNVDSGVLFVDTTNNRVGINTDFTAGTANSDLVVRNNNTSLSLATPDISGSGTIIFNHENQGTFNRIFSGGANGSNTLSVEAVGNVYLVTNDIKRLRAGTSELVLNDDGNNYDFRVEGDTKANLLFVNGTTDRIGIDDASPDALLTVNGIASFGAGAAATPSIAARGDLDTGIWFPAANTTAISIGGSERLRIDSSGRLLIGTSTSVTSDRSITPQIQLAGINQSGSAVSITNYSVGGVQSHLILGSSKSGTIATQGLVDANGTLGVIAFTGSDGTAPIDAAFISCEVDGPPGTNDMPGRLIFSTTADGASNPTERLRIDSSGLVGIGTSSPGGLLHVQSNLAGNNQLILTNIASSNSSAGSEIVFTQGASGFAAGKIQCDREGSYSTTTTSQDSALAFFTAADGVDSEKLRINSSGQVLIGSSTSIPVAAASSAFQSHTTVGAAGAFTRFSSTAASGPQLSFGRSKSATIGSFSAVTTGDVLSRIYSAGDNGADLSLIATEIRSDVDTGTVSGTSMPGRLVFSTTADGASTLTERMRIANDGRHTINSNAHQGTALTTTAPANLYTSTGTYTDTATAASGTAAHGTIVAFDNPAIAATNTSVTYTNASTVYIDGAPTAGTNVTITNAFSLFVAAGNSRFGGNVLSSSATGGIGYATGAGGAITQATSRTTGVTLNTICGAITLVSAAGTATWQSFTVTNSAVAATDNVIVNQKSGTDLYMIHVTNVAAGSFRISFATTGGTTTEQPVFNFSVIKAVAA